MEPIPETLEALGELESFSEGSSLEEQLRTTASRAAELVPGLVGVSVSLREGGLTFTVVATGDDIAMLDAVQYVAGGPCVDAIELGQGITTPDGLLSEHRWQDFARASAAAGVQSTLTLPVLDGDVVISTINLYGRETDTFVGKHEALATVFGAWAPGAVANADLSFTTRRAAEEAPTQLAKSGLVDRAIGIVAAARDVSVEEAEAQLQDSARRAGVPVHALARVLLDLYDAR